MNAALAPCSDVSPPAASAECPELGPVLAAAASYFGLLSDPTRLRILNSICGVERNVTAIVDATGVRQTNVSRHLAVLHAAGVVTRRKVRNNVFYKVADPMFAEVCRTVYVGIASRGVAEQANGAQAPGIAH
jgi:DNA-binding transcriptional ArsR family regulator